MQVELGPIATEDVSDWCTAARHVLNQMSRQGSIDQDLANEWLELIDCWCAQSQKQTARSSLFRWSQNVDTEHGEFLLSGLANSLQSCTLKNSLSKKERLRHRNFTSHLIQSFSYGLIAEDRSICTDQVMATMTGDAPPHQPQSNIRMSLWQTFK